MRAYYYAPFYIKITYKKGERSRYGSFIIEYAPTEDQPDTIKGEIPNISNGWKVIGSYDPFTPDGITINKTELCP